MVIANYLGVLQSRVPQVFATWTLDHTIFYQTHFVCSNNQLNTFIPSLSLELWCLIVVIISFLVMFVAPSVDNHTTHAFGALVISRLATHLFGERQPNWTRVNKHTFEKSNNVELCRRARSFANT